MSKIYSLSDLKFISVATLRAWMRGGAPGKYAVIDVRDLDYIGGHIKGCWHYPAGNFAQTLPELQRRLIDDGIEDVVFHCALSQVRGPSSTLKFLRSLEKVKENEAFFEKLNVWVLRGGFTSWQEKYGLDETVTEGYQRDLWE